MLIQQGDVLIRSAQIPLDARACRDKTLARGEATGHHHTITEGDVELFERNGTFYLRVLSGVATVTHQEHRAVTVPVGDYVIDRVREYDHFAEEARRVAD